MLEIRGTHGTCVTHAECIVNTGNWIPSNTGRGGPGVYLWGYLKSSDSARKLAIEWWKYSSNANRYQDYDDRNCAVIFASVITENDYFYDSTQLEFEEAFTEAVKIASGGAAQISDENMSKVFEIMILDIERDLGYKFNVIQARVSPPKKADFIEKKIVGNPIAYIVRNNLEAIKVVGYEKPENLS